VQLRALARAAVSGNIKVMLPMVTVPSELERAGALLDAAMAELEAEGIACARPALGMMVEVPAAAISAARFAAAFYSIGSNDLTQIHHGRGGATSAPWRTSTTPATRPCST